MKKPLILALLLLPCALIAQAVTPPAQKPAKDSETIQKEDVVVKAARLPKYRIATASSATLVDLAPEVAPFTVDTLTSDFIQERNPADLDQLLSYQPGIYQGGKTINARHAGQYTIRGFGGNDVLWGGMPLRGGGGIFFDPTLLERVDIVKGPIGGAYGGQSQSYDESGVGGTIMLHPKRPILGENFSDVMIKATAGHRPGYQGKWTLDSNYTLSDKLAIRVPLAFTLSNVDYTPKGGDRGRAFSMAPSIFLQAEDRLSLTIDTFVQRGRQPGNQGINVYNQRPVPGCGGWDGTVAQKDDFIDTDIYGLSVTLHGQFNDIVRTRTQFGTLYNHSKYDYLGPNYNGTVPGDSPVGSRNSSESIDQMVMLSQQVTFDYDFAAFHHTTLVGVDFSHIKERGRNFRETSTWDTQSQSKYGVLVQDVATWEGLSLLGGVRTDLHQSVKNEKTVSYSPRFGISYAITDAVILFANASITETPNFNFIQNKKVDPNKTLDSSWVAVQKEAGVRVNPVDDLWVSLSVFRIDQENTPINVSKSPNRGEEIYEEEGETWSQGIELAASGTLSKNWSMQAAYTWIDSDEDFHADPAHSFSIWSNYKIKALNNAVFGCGFKYRSKWLTSYFGDRPSAGNGPGRPPAGPDSAYMVDALYTFDLSLDMPVTDNSSIQFSLKNLFDQRGVESARHLQVFPNDGRTFEVAYRVRF